MNKIFFTYQKKKKKYVSLLKLFFFVNRALEELDNSDFQGRLLHVLPAKEKSSSDQQG